MFAKIVAFLALVAVAFASPKPAPQQLVYSTPDVIPAVGYAGYTGYSGYSAYPYAAPVAAAPTYPYAYSGYYVR